MCSISFQITKIRTRVNLVSRISRKCRADTFLALCFVKEKFGPDAKRPGQGTQFQFKFGGRSAASCGEL